MAEGCGFAGYHPAHRGSPGRRAPGSISNRDRLRRGRQRVCPSGTLGLRTPAHAAIWETLSRLPGPLALSSANRSGEPAATTADEARQALGEDVALLIDDGPTRYRQASTVVQVNGNGWSVLREG